MGDVAPVDLKAALRAQLGSQRRKVSGSAAGRRALEREANNPHDARLSRRASRGNTVQLNVEIPEDDKMWLARVSRESGEKINALILRLIREERARMEKTNA
jgi:hypothetical protein